jgi:putative membrane protein
MKTLRLARFELRRFTRGRLPAAALAILTVIPLLYGALYLAAFWDPYTHLNRIPVALVNDDKPARAADGTEVHAGKDLTDELLHRQIFDWQVTDAGHAEQGLRNGRYHLVFHVPADFSAALATGADPDRAARHGELSVVSDDATNYLSGLLARSAFSEIRAAAAESAAGNYFNGMLIGFGDLKTRTGEAADGAGQLREGAGRAATGADRLAGGAGDAKDGADQLATGLGAASSGADQLASGLAALDRGSAQLAEGANQAAGQTRAAADQINGAIDKWEPVLRRNATRIAEASTVIAAGAQALADNLDVLPAQADAMAKQAESVRDRLDAVVKEHPELADDPNLQAARKTADQLVDAAKQVRASLDKANVEQFRGKLLDVAATARQVAAEAPHLADDVRAKQAQFNKLVDGLGQLAGAADKISQGSHKSAVGAADLRDGLYRLSTGARELDGGLGQLAAGGQKLVGGISALQSGAGKLADGLTDGARKIPGFDDASARSDVLGNPVSLDRTARHAAATYGVGFAPYFLGLALWVGAMITYMLLRPLNRRHVMSGAPAWRVTLAGWLPGLAIGLAQAVVLFAVVTLALDLGPASPVKTLGLMMLTAAAFSAIVQFLGARLGPAGRLVALALLMLQLTSSGGTYPVQTTPAFFQAIHPYLPMTYVVEGLRHTINGGPSGPVVLGALVLAGFAAGALALTVGSARRARRMTPSTLHPELTM